MNKPNLLSIIETLKTVEHMGELNMEVAVVKNNDTDEYHECGTVHCVAGWYAVAKLAADPEHPLHGEEYVEYRSGIEMINVDSGLDLGLDLKSWANHYPELWGNDHGAAIWGIPEAWVLDAWDYANNLTGVIKHLERVQSRIDAS